MSDAPVVPGVSDLSNPNLVGHARFMLFHGAFLASAYGMSWEDMAKLVREGQAEYRKQQSAPPPGVEGTTPAQVEAGM